MYTKGFDHIHGSTTRAVAKEMATRQEIRYLGLHQLVSGLCARERMRIRRLLLCCMQNLCDAGVEMRIFSTLPNHVWKQGHGSTAEK